MEQKNDFFAFKGAPKAPDFVQIRKTEEPPPPPPAPKAPPPAPPPPRKGFDLLRMLNLRGMEMDGDRKVIIAVMLLLLGETEDELLILALLYIML